MPQYKYKAVDKAGKIVKGKLNAVNESDLEAKLNSFKLDVINFKEQKENFNFSFTQSINEKDLIILCTQLEQLEKAGVPLLESLSDMRDVENVKMKIIISEIYESVKNGRMLSQSFQEHKNIFDDVFVGLVAAGEMTGKLGEVFEQLSNHLKWVNDIKSKIKKASAYPIFVMLLMSGVIAMMMLYVVPKMVEFLTAQNIDLPSYTVALIGTSKFFQNYYIYIFSFPIIFFVVNKILVRSSKAYCYFMDQIILSIPIIGETIKKIEIARFCRFFAITYRSGIPILDCLEISGRVIRNLIIKDNITRVKVAISEGQSLTNALKLSGNFPSMVIRMIKVGEDSGKIDLSLDNINFFYDREVNDAVTALIAMIQPALTIMLGAIMMWIAVAVFGPLYGSFSKMAI